MIKFALRGWRGIYRGLWLLCLACGATGCGSSGGYATPAYGIPYVNLPLGASTYQPPSPIQAGTTLTFTAQLPYGTIEEADVTVGTQALGWHTAPLLDDGIAPDSVANDRVYTGILEWQPSYGTGEMYVNLYADGSYYGDRAIGQRQLPRLTVLP